MVKKIAKNQKIFKKITRFEWISLIIWWLLAIWAATLTYNIFVIQVKDPKNYRAKAAEQYISEEVTLKGDILDRNGIKLASDEIYREVYAHKKKQDKRDPDYNPELIYDHTQKEVAAKLSPILNMSENELLVKLNNHGPIINLKKDIDKNTEKQIKALGWRDLSIGQKTKRVYPQGNLAAHVLGYYNSNANISTGIEFVAQNKLKNVPNSNPIKYSKNGKIIFDTKTNPIALTENPKGENVTLTIDSAIQFIAEKELFSMATEKNADGGFAIVINPQNGEILAYAVYPNYDPNNYLKASNKQLKNWPIVDTFAPGSTFKIITIASAMELGKITEHSKVYDTCQIQVAGFSVKNSHCYPPGMISLVELFERSSNVASFGIAKLMTDREFYNQIRKFGFGQNTGIDLAGESPGIWRQLKNWDKTTKMVMSYGYGTEVSAMQMVAAVGAIANNGLKVTPHIIKYPPEEESKKVKYTQVVSPETAQTVTKLLTQSIEQGKSTLKMDKYYLAAKTGTSNKVKNGKYVTNESYTSAIGYFPVKNPEILIYVCFDNPKGYGVWGNTVAGPVFHEIAEQTARILNIKQDK